MTHHLARHFQSLLHLKAVINAGSVNSAAELIGLSQPALTRSISRLEDALQVKLVDRTPRGVVPTAFGESLLEYIEVADNTLDNAVAALASLKDSTEGRLVCGGTSITMNALVPAAVADLQRRKPKAKIRVIEGYTTSLFYMLRRGEVDVVVGPRMAEFDQADLIWEEIATEQVGIFVKRGHQLLTASSNSLNEMLERHSWVVPNSAGPLYRLIQQEFARYDRSWPRTYLESSSMGVMRWFARETDRLVLTTSHMLAPELLDGKVSDVHGDWQLPKSQIVVYTRRSETASPLTAAFIRSVKKSAESWPQLPSSVSRLHR